MPDDNEVAGRLGDVSGRLGDVSGRLGDVSGRLGDVSGRLGDVSGRSGVDEVEEALFMDREADQLRYNEARIRRLEREIVLIMRWANAQFLTRDTSLGGEVKDLQKELDRRTDDFDNRLTALDRRIRELVTKPPQT
jgi:hypothetical protein